MTDVWTMAQNIVKLAGENAQSNRGQKSKEYTDARLDLVSCCGPKWSRQLIREAFAARDKARSARYE